MPNIDLNLFKKTKVILNKNKNNNKITYLDQIKEIFSYYQNIPVEEVANIIIANYQKEYNISDIKRITLQQEKIQVELDYLRKIHNAIITKIPNIEFKEMLLLLLDHYTKTDN